MGDFEIDVIDEKLNENIPVQLPVNFLLIGEVEQDDVKVYIKQSVYKALEEYALSDTSNELGTILIGNDAVFETVILNLTASPTR